MQIKLKDTYGNPFITTVKGNIIKKNEWTEFDEKDKELDHLLQQVHIFDVNKGGNDEMSEEQSQEETQKASVEGSEEAKDEVKEEVKEEAKEEVKEEASAESAAEEKPE